MKSKSAYRLVRAGSRNLAIALISLCAAHAAQGATLYWDGNGTTAGAGTTPTGTWGVDAFWSSSALGTVATAAYTTASDVVFSAGTDAGTFTVSLTTTVDAASLAFEEGATTLSGTGGIITLSGVGGKVTVNSGALAMVGNNTTTVLGGTSGLTKLGAGTLTLNGSAVNTVTGGLTVNGGTLALDFANLATSTNLIDSGNALSFGGGAMTIKGLTGANATSQTFASTTVNAGGGSLLVDPNNGTSTTVNLNSLGTLGSWVAGSSLLVGKAVTANTGTVAITTTTLPTNGLTDGSGIYGGRIVLADGTANTGYDWATTTTGSSPYTLSAYSGYTTMVAGATTDTNNDTTGSLTLTGAHTHDTLKLTSGATLALGSNLLTLNAGGLLSTGSAASTLSGSAGATGLMGSASGDLIVHQYNSGGLTISAVIGDNGGATALTKAGSGALILSGANTYTGSTFINAGILQANSATALGSSGNITFAGGTLQYTGASSSQDWSTRFKNSTAAPIALDTNRLSVTLAGVIPSSNTAGLTQSGLGVLKLTGANAYSGNTTINGGTLVIASDSTGTTNPLGAYPGSVTAANITLNGGAKLATLATGLGNSGTTITLGANRGIVLGTGLQTVVAGYRQYLTISGPISGSGGLIVAENDGYNNGSTGGGANTTFGGSNTYTGDTIILDLGTQDRPFNPGSNGLQYSTFDYNTTLVPSGTPAFNKANNSPILGGLKGNRNFALVHQGAGTVSAGNNNQNTIYTGNLANGSGACSFTKIGTGVLQLGGTNTITNGFTVNGGTLVETATGTSLGTQATSGNNGLTVANSATFAFLPTAAGPLTLGQGKLNLANGSTIGTAIGGTASQSVITSTVAALTAGSITMNVSGIPGVTVPASTTTNNLISVAAGGLTSGGATYTLGKIYNATNFTVGTFASSNTAISLDVTQATALSAETWKGGLTGGTNVWALSNGTTASNWTTDGTTATSLTPGPTADVSFVSTNSPTDRTNMVLGANMKIKTLTFSDSEGSPSAVTLNADGYQLTIIPAASSAGITVNSGAGAVTLNSFMALGAAQTWTNNSSSPLTIGGDIANGSNALTITGTGDTTINGQLRYGSGGLTKSGDGTLTLNGASVSFQGTTTVNAGIVKVGSPYALGFAESDINGFTYGWGYANLTFGASSTGKVQLNGNNVVLSSLSTNATVGTPIIENASSTPAVLTVTESNNTAAAQTHTYAGVLQDGTGGGALSLQAPTVGTLTLSGANTYSGGTTIPGGTLKVGSVGALGGSSAGAVTVSGGILDLNGNSPTSSTNLAVTLISGSIINSGAAAALPGTSYIVQSGTVSAALGGGSSSLTKITTGTVFLSGANTFTGSTTISGGILNAGVAENPGVSGPFGVPATPTGAIVFNGGTLQYSVANPYDYSARLTATGNNAYSIDTNGQAVTFATGLGASGTSGLTKAGSGTLTLSGAASTYIGTTTVSAGVLAITSPGTLGNGSSTNGLTMSGGTLDLGTTSQTVGAVSITAASTAFISGSTIQNGSLTGTSFAASNAIGNAIISANLLANGAAGLAKSGAGTLTLSGANTYTGTTTLTAGILNAGSAENGTNGPLGETGAITFAGGTLQFGSVLNNATVAWGTRIQNSSAGAIRLDTNGQTVTLSGAIPVSNNQGMVKLGAGTLVLSDANLYTGTTTISGGTLQIGDGTTGSLNGTTGTALTFNGTGMFNVQEAAASTQGMGALTFTAGDGTVRSTFNATSATLTFASLAARSAGATENYVLSGGGTANKIVLTSTTNAPLAASGSNNQGVFFGGSEYARYSVANGTFQAVDYGTDSNAQTVIGTGATLGANNAAFDVKITGAITAQTTASVNTLNDAGNNNLTLAPGQTLSVNGILKSGNTVGGATLSGGAGIMTTSSGNELVIRTDGANDLLTISSIILANGTNALTKSGTGTLVLSGRNTYTGAISINGGVLSVQDPTALGATSGVTVNSGGALQLQGTFTIDRTLALNGTGVSNTGALRNISGVSKYTGNITLNSNTRINSDAGILRHGIGAGTINGNSYGLTVGGAGDASLWGVLSGTGTTLTFDGTGNLRLGAANTYTGATYINSGTVFLNAGETVGTNGPLGASPAANPGSIVFGGGTLQFSAGNTNDYSGRFSTASQAIKIDTSSQSITFATPLMSGTGGSLSVSGLGTLTLTALSTYSGATTVNNTATLALNLNTAAGNNVVSSSSALTLGGNLNVIGTGGTTARSQTFNGTTFGVGNSTITPTLAAASSTANVLTLNLGALSRNAGGTSNIVFTTGNTSTTNTQINTSSGSASSLITDANGVAYLTFGTSATSIRDWAVKDAGNTQIVQAPASGFYTAATATTIPGNADIGALSPTITGDLGNNAVASIRFDNAGVRTLTLDDNIGGDATFSVGGILVSSNVGGNATTFTGTGTLQGPSAGAGDLVINNWSSGSATISMPIGGAGFTKSGTGTVILSAANSYTGPTTIGGGTLQIGNGGTTGDLGGTTGTLTNNGTLTFNRSAASSPLTLSNNITGSGGLTQQGTGTTILLGALSYRGLTTVNAGTLTFDTGSVRKWTSRGNTVAANGNRGMEGNGLQVNNGTVNVAGLVDVENVYITGGVINVLPGGEVVNRNSVGNGYFGLSIGGNEAVGAAYGMLNMTGGALTSVNDLNSGQNPRFGVGIKGTAAGLIRVSDGTLNAITLLADKAEITQLGGNIRTAGGNAPLLNTEEGNNNTGVGMCVVNIAGGVFDNGMLGLNFGGGTAGSSKVVVNMNAGTLWTQAVTQLNGNQGIMNFNGGTLKVGGNSATFTPTAISNTTSTFSNYVNGAFGAYAGGAVIDTNNFSITIPSNLMAPAGTGVTAIAVPGGGGGALYVGAPMVTISDAGTTQSGTTASASKTIAMASTTGVFVGQAISGTGIPNGSIVTSVTSNTSITISQNASAAGSPTLTFKGQGATAYATYSGGAVTGYVVTNPGVGYVGTLSATLSGGTATGGTASTNPTNANFTTATNTSGGLTKNGVGTLTLSGANTYSGATTINVGTLKLTATNTNNIASSSAINIASGAVLDVSSLSTSTLALANGQTLMGNGTVTGGSVAVGSGATVAPGDRTLVTPAKGTLTIQNALDLTGGTTNLRLFSSTESDRLVQSTSGTITWGGTLNLTQASNFSGTAAAGNSWDLFDWTGTPTGTFTTVNLPTLSGLTWDTTNLYINGTIALASSGGGAPTIGTITATPTAATIITGGSTGFGFTVVNSGTATLNFATAAGTNTAGTVSGTTAVNAGDTSSSVTGLSFNGTTVGLAQTGTFSVSDATATNNPQNGTVTVNVLGHSNAALAVASGNNQTIITGGSLAAVTLDLTNSGSNLSPLDVSTLSNLSGSTGTAVVASNGSGAYTATGFDAVTVGMGKTLATSLSAGDEQALSGASAMATKNANVTYDVYDHASPGFTPATLALGNIHAGYSGPLGSSNNISVSNGTPGDNRVALKGAGTGTNNVSLTTITGLLNNGSATPLSASLASGIAGGTLLDQNITYTFADDSSLSGNSASLSSPSITITGQVYSGAMVWSGTSGNWSTDANWNDSLNANVHVAPGRDSGFTGVDSATFDTSGTHAVTLDVAANIQTLNLSTGDYTLSGSSSLTLAGASAKITSAGTQAISAPVILANNAEVAVSGGTLAVSGGINGSGMTLLKSGGGILELSGSSNYSGLTTVDNGTLLVNTSIPGAVSVTSSIGTATLGGTGSIGGTLNVTGILSPGGSIVESLASGALTLNTGSTFAYQATSGTLADLMVVNGGLALTSVTLDLTGATSYLATGALGDKLTLLSYTGTPITTGFTSYTDDATYLFGSGVNAKAWTFNYNDTVKGNNTPLEATGTSFVTVALDAYFTWAASKGLDNTVGKENAPNLDPDNDGANNLAEFAFDGNPLNGADKGKVYALQADSDYVGDPTSAKELILTVAVRSGTPLFAGATSPTATWDGITYTIEGSTTLTTPFGTQVHVVPTPVVTGLPAAGSGYEYRSFSLEGSDGLAGKGFMRAKAVK